MKDPREQTNQLNPQERLEIALTSGNNDSLLKEAAAYVLARVSAKYPNAKVVEFMDGGGGLLALPPYFVYSVVDRNPTKKPVEIRSFWRNKLLRTDIKDIIEERRLVTARYSEGNRLEVHVDDGDLYRACQEVTKLTNCNVRTQL